MIKRWFAVISMIIISTLCTLLVLEFLLRMAGYKPPQTMWKWAQDGFVQRLDPDLIYVPQQNIRADETGFTTNSLGMRIDHEDYNETKFHDNSVKKIMLIGDSFVWGNTEDTQTYAHHLQNMLAADSSQTLVLNAGVSGYGTDQEYVYLLEKIVPVFKPDSIVWNINNNDVTDIYDRPLFTLRNGELVRIPGWRNRIYVQGWLQQKIVGTFLEKSVIIQSLIAEAGHINLYDLGVPEPERDAWSLTKMQLLFTDLQKRCAHEGIKLVFTLMPSQANVQKLDGWEWEESMRTRILETVGKDTPVIDMNTYFSEAYAATTVSASSSAQILGSQSETESLFLDETGHFAKGTWHPSGAGNFLLAKSLLPYLQ